MLFKHVSIASVSHVDAPVRLSSVDIMERLQPTLDRLGIRGNLLEEVAGIYERRIWDGPLDELSTALPYDAEGTPRQRLDLVVDGVSAAIAHDRRTAAAAGASSTGHAVEGGERWGAVPDQPRVGAGDGGSSADLAATMRRGLMVSDFWYTRILDPRTVVITGLTRNGVWLIEDGKVSSPVQNMRFTQSYPQALAPGAVLGVGRHAVSLPVDLLSARVPALRLASWNCTGGASG